MTLAEFRNITPYIQVNKIIQSTAKQMHKVCMADHYYYYYYYKRYEKMNMEIEMYHTNNKEVTILYMADLGQPTVSKHKQSSCLILSAYCSRHN
jgi:hypothetical protein